MIKNVLEYLEQSAAKSPDKTAVADEHNAFTYQELLDNAQRVGAVLQKETPVRTAVPVYMERAVMHWQHLWERQRQAAFTAC